MVISFEVTLGAKSLVNLYFAIQHLLDSATFKCYDSISIPCIIFILNVKINPEKKKMETKIED